MRMRVSWLGVLGVLILVGFTVMPHPASSSPVAQAPRNLTVLVGGGQDTLELLAFFPMNVRIRQGDAITWKAEFVRLMTLSR